MFAIRLCWCIDLNVSFAFSESNEYFFATSSTLDAPSNFSF